MGKKIKIIVTIFIVIAIIAALFYFSNAKDDLSRPKQVIEKKSYVIEEIVPEEVYSIKPIYEDVQKENFTSLMAKIKEGMKEIGRSYRITGGETIMKFTFVAEKIVYVQKREIDSNCTANTTMNPAIEPDN